MGKVKGLVAIGLVALVSVAIVGCKMIQKTPEAVQKEVMAKVGDYKITRGDLDQAMAPYLAQAKQSYGANYMENAQVKQQIVTLEKQQLNSMVNQQVVVQEGEKMNLVSDQDLQKQIDEKVSETEKAFGSQDAFNNALKQENITLDQFKQQISNEVIIDAVLKNISKDIKVTPEQAEQYYNEHKMLYTTKDSGADVSHILVKTKEEADNIETQLKKDNGKDFAALAKEYSEDPGSKDKGGSLGWVAYDSTQLVPQFMDGMRTLTQNGQISQPVQSQYGWHIIKVENVKLAYQPFKDAEKTVTQQLTEQQEDAKFQSDLTQWKKDLDVKIYDNKITG
ncbi:peptidylprolyl isomerase [uncultured Clostridium sp.]|uniref:peptidylprolyl isomerase n=1 Tax=uncultured Clostridium sp. TaxID=59620 RepID=UPI002626198D|nr:peptidylprolyl isomerase [uncultured Clostridium sp.]